MQRQRTDQAFTNVQNLTIDSIDAGYTIEELLSPNSITMDDSDTGTLASADGVVFSQDDSGSIGVSTFDQHVYSTLFDSANSADSSNYPF